MNDVNTQQFVIQKHTTPSGIHWDLMLEYEGVLWTWRIHTDPDQISNDALKAERITDHPLRFLAYEGPVQKATAFVQISDKGNLMYLSNEMGQIRCRFYGNILRGKFMLKQEDEHVWSLQRE